MSILRNILSACAIGLVPCAPAFAEGPASVFPVLDRWYQSDPVPLETEVTATLDTALGKVTELRFRGHDREWVTGRLALPMDVQNPPVVIALHGLGQSRDQWFRLDGPYSFPGHHTRALLNSGVAVLALDARDHGARIEAGKDFDNAYTYLEKGYFEGATKMIANTAIDVARAIDYLEGSDQVDASRVGVIGFSLGAMVGWVASAVDDRVDRALLIGMPIIPADPPRFTDQPLYLPGLKDKAIMLLAAREDTFYTIAQMKGLFDGIEAQDKALVVIDGPHDMPAQTAEHAVRFLAEKL